MPLLLLSLPPADKVYVALGGVAFAVFALVLDMVKGIVQEWREKRKKVKQNSFFYQAEKQVLLDQATERICLATKAHHVSLFRLHNGDYFEGNDSIKKMSMVSESIGLPGLARWKAQSQSMLMSNFPHMVLGMGKQDFYAMHTDDALDFDMGRVMNEREYVTTIAMLILGRKSQPLGVLMLSWCDKQMYINDLDADVLLHDRRDLSFTLSD
jgi:hypothetical protein